MQTKDVGESNSQFIGAGGKIEVRWGGWSQAGPRAEIQGNVDNLGEAVAGEQDPGGQKIGITGK